MAFTTRFSSIGKNNKDSIFIDFQPGTVFYWQVIFCWENATSEMSRFKCLFAEVLLENLKLTIGEKTPFVKFFSGTQPLWEWKNSALRAKTRSGKKTQGFLSLRRMLRRIGACFCGDENVIFSFDDGHRIIRFGWAVSFRNLCHGGNNPHF